MRSVLARPPTASEASSTRHVRPAPHSRRAQQRPAKPPPTINTSASTMLLSPIPSTFHSDAARQGAA